MKQKISKIITGISFFTLLLGLGQPLYAQTATSPSPSPTSQASKLEKQIDNLKDRIASRVAQLNLVDRRSLIGTVTDVSETQLTVTDTKNNTRFIDVDELTKFSSPSAKGSFGISDIKSGSLIGAIGLYNKESKRLLARWVDITTLPRMINGAILSLDKENFSFTVATLDQNNITIDVESVTKTSSYTKADGLVKSGFSKLQQGQRVTIVGYPNTKDASRIVASRIIVFPDLPANPGIALVKPEDIAPVTPSTGSGHKLTPIIK